MNDRDFRSHARHLAIAWAALIVLMLLSLGSAYLPLGIGNAIAGIVIAMIKTAIVAALFMGLARAPAVLRIVAAVALAAWCVMLLLSGVDRLTRSSAPATFQPPGQVAPRLSGELWGQSRLRGCCAGAEHEAAVRSTRCG